MIREEILKEIPSATMAGERYILRNPLEAWIEKNNKEINLKKGTKVIVVNYKGSLMQGWVTFKAGLKKYVANYRDFAKSIR